MVSPVERAVIAAGSSALVIVFAIAAVGAAWNRNTVFVVPLLLMIAASITIGYNVGKLEAEDE